MALHRKTSDPNVTCPEDLYTREELARFECIADIENQIDAIDQELQRLDEAYDGADSAGDYGQLRSIEDRVDILIELQSGLYAELNSLRTPD